MLDFASRCRRVVSTAPDRRRRRDALTTAEKPSPESRRTMSEVNDDFTRMDDSALLSRRAEMRAELERLPSASPGHAALAALYDESTLEVNERARKAWSRASC